MGQRIVSIPGFSPDQILSTRWPHLTLFEVFEPFFTTGEKGTLKLYYVTGGNHAILCKCDLERPLLAYLKDHPTEYPGAEFEGTMAGDCQVDLVSQSLEANFDTAGAAGYPNMAERRVCTKMLAESL